MKKYLWILLIIVVGMGYYFRKDIKSFLPDLTNKETIAQEELIFADASKVWWTAPTIVAKAEGFFEKNGLKVNAFDVNTGLASKNAVLSGSADIGLVASTPLAIGATKNEQVLILGKYVSSAHLLSILSEIDIDHSPCILANQQCDQLTEQLTMVYVPGTISEFYLIKYLQKYNKLEILDNLKKHSLKLAPPAIPSSFGSTVANRKINLAVIWEPLASEIRKPRSSLKNSYKLAQNEPDPDLYEMALYLITTPKVWDKKKNAILKFVASVEQAGIFITENSKSTRETLEKRYGYPNGWLEDRWTKVDFIFKTSPNEIKPLIIQDAELTKITKSVVKIPDVEYMLVILEQVRNYLNKVNTPPEEGK